MNKIKNKLIFLIFSLFIGGISFNFANNSPILTEAAVNTYNRDVDTYYTEDFETKILPTDTGVTLLEKLHSLMYETHEFYNTYNDLWTYTQYLDKDFDNEGNIILLYSRYSVSGLRDSSVWNREHVWCQSLSGGLYSSTGSSTTGAGSDMHHLHPASTSLNSARNNNPYGIVSVHNSTTIFNGTDNYLSGGVFEPADYIKGDIARTLMYVYMHYSSEVGESTNEKAPVGALDITNIIDLGLEETTQSCWDLLLSWNKLDPVDMQEVERNNAACLYQGNRNPFIDHPEYAELIWGSNSDKKNITIANPNPSVEIGSTVKLDVFGSGAQLVTPSITYISDNPSIATIDSNGLVTGVTDGIVRIKAKSLIEEDIKTAYAMVTVGDGYVPQPKNYGLVKIKPTSTSTAISSNNDVCEVNSFKNTFTNAFSQVTKNNTITYNLNFKKTIKSIVLMMHSNNSTGAGYMSVTVNGEDYFSWGSSSSPSTFSVLAGKYSTTFIPIDITNDSALNKTGNVIISLSCTTNSIFLNEIIFDFEERMNSSPTSVIFTPNQINILIGDTIQSNFKLTPLNSFYKNLEYESGDLSICGVNSFGELKGLNEGNTTITLKIDNILSATISVNVVAELQEKAPTLTSIEALSYTTEFYIGDKYIFDGVITATYSDLSTSDITNECTFSSPDMSTAGEKTVTITHSQTSLTTSITITVSEHVLPIFDVTYTKFSKVTDVNELKDNDRIIFVVLDKEVFYSMSSIQNSNNRSANTISFDDNGNALINSDIQVITLNKHNSLWSLGVDDGYLFAASSSNNYLRTEKSLDNNGMFSIKIDDEQATIIAQGENTHNYLRYNASNDLFSCYLSTSSMKDVMIYKSYEAEADIWGYNFLTDYTSGCLNDGYTSLNWSGAKTSYQNLTETAKNILIQETPDASSSSSFIKQALARYDQIVNKYDNFEKFIDNRVAQQNNHPIIFKDFDSDNDYFILAVFTFSLILSGSLYLCIKKKIKR